MDAKFWAACVYFPFGVILMCIRIFLGFHAFIVSCILPKSWSLRSPILRILCSILGIIVTQENVEKRSTKSKVIVSNHVSPMDHTAVSLVLPCLIPNVWPIPKLLQLVLGYKDLGANEGRDVLIQNAREYCRTSACPLLVFPEGAMTNGRKGLLKFSSWPFCLDQPVQPVVITISRPAFAQLSPIIIGSRWWLDTLWLLFVPYTHYYLTWLDVEEARASESPDQFANRVQMQICTASSLVPTPHTCQDAVDYAKRIVLEQRMQKENPKLNSVADQVKNILPQVPIEAIREDLRKTNSLEQTVQNFIEGRVHYQPEVVNFAELAARRAILPKIEADPTTWKAVFEARKRATIEENRQKYLIRKGLLKSAAN